MEYSLIMRFNNTEVWGFKHAIRGMRNPKNSWNRIDSTFEPEVKLGENDLKLCLALIRGGSEHRKFLRQIFVSVDITAPLYWFKEWDTYKVGTTANSTSTMHKLTSKPITLEDFELDDFEDIEFEGGEVNTIISYLEQLRQKYLDTKDKKYWKELIRWLPSGYCQTRTVTMNYENILNMVHQRKNHKLNEWSGKDESEFENFISWAKLLPYMKEFLEVLGE